MDVLMRMLFLSEYTFFSVPLNHKTNQFLWLRILFLCVVCANAVHASGYYNVVSIFFSHPTHPNTHPLLFIISTEKPQLRSSNYKFLYSLIWHMALTLSLSHFSIYLKLDSLTSEFSHRHSHNDDWRDLYWCANEISVEHI